MPQSNRGTNLINILQF